MTAIPLRRKLVYSAITIVSVLLLFGSVLLAVDVYLHHRVQYLAGVNVWGYRGDVVGARKPGEVRVVAIGGSTVFGYGLPWNESWPYYLERKIAAAQGGLPPVTVVNLGIPTDSARTFVATLNDYAYLQPDIAIFYEGYNDLGLDVNPPRNRTNPAVSHYLAWRHQSPIFRWTGYFPIFPLVLNEKAQMLLHGKDLQAAYGNDVVFRPGLATRATAGALKTAADLGVALERRFGRLTNTAVAASTATNEDCGRWSEYCGAIEAAVRQVLARNGRAVVVSQPYVSDLHVDQQQALAAMLHRRFGGDRRVRYVNLGRLINMDDKALVYDGLHLVAKGNEMIANALVPTVVELVR